MRVLSGMRSGLRTLAPPRSSTSAAAARLLPGGFGGMQGVGAKGLRRQCLTGLSSSFGSRGLRFVSPFQTSGSALPEPSSPHKALNDPL